MKGTIRITDKVYFEYYKFLKPAMGNPNYDVSWKLYEASKQLIEVENVNQVGENEYSWIIINTVNKYKIENKQPCKAEIKDNKATIISLIKE